MSGTAWHVAARVLLIAGVLAWSWPLLVAPQSSAAPWAADQERERSVLAVRVDGQITPVVADHLVDGVRRAEEARHQAFLVELDTPGGLSTSMREIVQAFLGAEVPVIVHVSPAGARAASAGALITFSAHVAAMAPGTTIGAATPVDLQGGEISDKVINDAAAFAESVATERGRNAGFAEAAVREGEAATAERAVEIDAVDLVAADRAALFAALDGRAVTLADSSEVTLRTRGAPVVDHEMGFFDRLLQILADPNLAFLFISLGSLAVIYELASPGAGLGGVIGAVLLILGFVSLSVLPVNVAGILLLVLAVALLVAELFTPGVGAFAGGGALALALSGLFLFEGPFAVNPAVLWPVAVVVGAGAVLAGRLALRARRAKPVSGASAMVGQETVVRDAKRERGRARLEGTWWNVRSRGGPLADGQRVRVVEVRDLTLLVEPITEEKQ
ncbi:membrane-bound serine protease (ClpP class) [Amycolatopsis arida]|uniref:Membrane-bound serine protease (ClpP class) n=1 Tax=Amycolatopsis arida TaxID=587909 RepID=A0A1I6AQX0_9PSEU|nr:nodulation protein NfeD [Amycolatopsis arida]TDX97598.1 membrane-bound serine protease (ClpP class) [Amycolatopsis arida]SFQ71128.1 membrane-bound serine protease (ClpP class) [Amycolatopsis arida]